jgi:hypothetical protein
VTLPTRIDWNDRRVHARTPAGNEVVRYDRAGKWYVESADLPREKLTIDQAVQMALAPGTTINFGLSGGSRFDALVRGYLPEGRSS